MGFPRSSACLHDNFQYSRVVVSCRDCVRNYGIGTFTIPLKVTFAPSDDNGLYRHRTLSCPPGNHVAFAERPDACRSDCL